MPVLVAYRQEGTVITDRVAASSRVAASLPASAAFLLQRATGAYQKWPELCRGFRALVCARAGERESRGTVTVRPGGDVTASLDDAELQALTAAYLARVSRDCTPRFFRDGPGRFPLSFCGNGSAGAECRIVVHRPDGVALSYCLDGAGRLRTEERVAAGVRTVILVEEVCRANPGRVLPVRVSTTRWDATNGALLGSALAIDRYTRLDFVWLPVARQLTTSSLTRGDTALLEFADHALL